VKSVKYEWSGRNVSKIKFAFITKASESTDACNQGERKNKRALKDCGKKTQMKDKFAFSRNGRRKKGWSTKAMSLIQFRDDRK
jgi:hypothetical protein